MSNETVTLIVTFAGITIGTLGGIFASAKLSKL